MLSGLLALAGHWIFEPAVSLETTQWALMLALGIGPTGGAFYLWSFAMRRGDARMIGVFSNATPILSTLMLVIVGGSSLTGSLLCAALLVTLSSLVVFCCRKKLQAPDSPPSDTGRPDRSTQREAGVGQQAAENFQASRCGLRQSVADVHVLGHVAVAAQRVLAFPSRHFQMHAGQDRAPLPHA